MQYPGVYQILDTEHDLSYYGESEFLSHRLTKHFEALKAGWHEKGWKYAHVDNQGKPIRTPYSLKPGEISYDQWIEQQKK